MNFVIFTVLIRKMENKLKKIKYTTQYMIKKYHFII